MTISFSGLASGLDTSSWVESLVALKRAKVESLQVEKENVLLSKDTLNSIKAFFSSFRSTIEKITDTKFNVVSMDLFAQNLAVSANLDVLTATTTSEAEEGTYNIKVEKLASNTNVTSNYNYTTTIVETTTATSNSLLKHLGVNAGNIAVNVNGVTQGVNIQESDTIATFIEKMRNIGVDASYNEDSGIFSMNLDSDDINDIGGTNIVSALHLADVNEGYSNLERLEIERVETVWNQAEDGTLLSELGVKNGDIQISANDTTYSYSVDNSKSMGEFVSELGALGLDVSFENGIFILADATITDVGTTDIINGLGLQTDVYSQSQASSTLKYNTVTTTTTSATAGTLLNALETGVTVTGDMTVIVKNSNNEYSTINVTGDSTIGDVLAGLTNAGLSATIDSDGVVEISGGTITGGTYDALTALGLNSEPYTAIVTGNSLTETVVEYEIVNYDTRFVEDLGVAGGYLQVTDVEGDIYYEKIYSGQTIGDFMADMANLGINTSLNLETGVLTITGGSFATLDDEQVQDLVDAAKIVETDANYIKGTDLLTSLYGTPTISVDQTSVASTYAMSRALTQSVTNTVNATTATTLGSLGLSGEGTAIFDVRGDQRTISLTADMTVQGLIDSLAAQGIEASWDSDFARITINNATLSGGTSNLSDVLNLTTSIAGKYVTSDALNANIVTTTEFSASTTLGTLGVSGQQEVVLVKEDLSTYTFTVSETTTMQGMLDELNSNGVVATIQNGVFSIEGGYIQNTAIENALGLETVSLGFSNVLGTQLTTTIVTTVTGDTTLGSIVDALGTDSDVASGYNATYDGTALTVSESTTLDNFISQIEALGGIVSLDSTGRMFVEGGVLSGTVATALGFTTTSVTQSVSATGETITTVTTVTASEETTMAMLGLGDSTVNIKATDGSTIGTITTTADTTLGNLFASLGAYGIDASMHDGVVTIQSNNEYYVEGGVVTSLGIGTTVSSSTTTVSQANSSSALVSTTYSVTADSSTTLGELGIGNTTITVSGVDGVSIGTIVTDSEMTVGDLLTAFAGYDISGTIENGVISLDSYAGNYVTGDAITSLGIGTTTETRTITTGVANTSTISISGTYSVNADETTTLGQIGLGASTITVSSSDGSVLGTITTNADMTIGDLFDSLSTYYIEGSIDDGVISLDSSAGNYITGGITSNLGIGTVVETQTVTNAVVNTSTAAVSSTYTITADSSTTLGELGYGASVITIRGIDSQEVGTITTNADMTIGDMLTALAGYGISGTINDGVVSLESATNNYATGDILTSMGIGTTNATYTTTAGATSTSTTTTPITYTDTVTTTELVQGTQTVVVTNSVVLTEPVIGSETITVTSTITTTEPVTNTTEMVTSTTVTVTEPITSSITITVTDTYTSVTESNTQLIVTTVVDTTEASVGSQTITVTSSVTVGAGSSGTILVTLEVPTTTVTTSSTTQTISDTFVVTQAVASTQTFTISHTHTCPANSGTEQVITTTAYITTTEYTTSETTFSYLTETTNVVATSTVWVTATRNTPLAQLGVDESNTGFHIIYYDDYGNIQQDIDCTGSITPAMTLQEFFDKVYETTNGKVKCEFDESTGKFEVISTVSGINAFLEGDLANVLGLNPFGYEDVTSVGATLTSTAAIMRTTSIPTLGDVDNTFTDIYEGIEMATIGTGGTIITTATTATDADGKIYVAVTSSSDLLAMMNYCKMTATGAKDKKYSDYHFVLTNDVSIAWNSGGSNWYEGIQLANSVFDGNGHRIDAVIRLIPDQYTTYSSATTQGYGLFSQITDSKVQNLYLTGTIRVQTTLASDGTAAVGGLVGYAENSTIEGVVSGVRMEVTHTFGSTTTTETLGGLVGYASGSTVNNVRFAGQVRLGTIETMEYFAGLVGTSSGTTYDNIHMTPVTINTSATLIDRSKGGNAISHYYMAGEGYNASNTRYVVANAPSSLLPSDTFSEIYSDTAFQYNPNSTIRAGNVSAVGAAVANTLMSYSATTKKIEVYSNSGTLKGFVDVTADMSSEQVLAAINNSGLGVTATVDANNNITISGGYIAGKGLDEMFALNNQANVTIDNLLWINQTGTRPIDYADGSATMTITVSSSSTMGNAGLTSNGQIYVLDGSANCILTITVTTSTTFSQLESALASYANTDLTNGIFSIEADGYDIQISSNLQSILKLNGNTSDGVTRVIDDQWSAGLGYDQVLYTTYTITATQTFTSTVIDGSTEVVRTIINQFTVSHEGTEAHTHTLETTLTVDTATTQASTYTVSMTVTVPTITTTNGTSSVVQTLTIEGTTSQTIPVSLTVTVGTVTTTPVSHTVYSTVTIDTFEFTTYTTSSTYTLEQTSTQAVIHTIFQTMTIEQTSTQEVIHTVLQTFTVENTSTEPRTVNLEGTVEIQVTTASITTNNTTCTLDSTTTFDNLNLTSDQYVSVYANGTMYTITVESQDTVGDLLTSLAGLGIHGSITDGKITFVGNENAYIVDMSDTLEAALSISESSYYTTSTHTALANTTSAAQGTQTINTLTTDDTFAILGLTSDGTINVHSNGANYVVTVHSTDTVADILTSLAGYGISGSVYNGILTLTGDGEGHVTSVSDNLKTLLKLGDAETSTTSQDVVANTDSTAQNYNYANTLTTDDTFAQVGLTSEGTITVMSDGTQYVVTVEASDTVDDILTTLAGLGITGSVSNGRLTLQGDRQAYITGISENLNNTLALGATNYNTSNQTVTSNTASSVHATSTINTLTTDDTFGQLGLTADGTITVVTDGTEYVVTVNSSDTVDDIISTLAGMNISASVSNGIITLQGTDGAYIKGISDNVKTLLKLSDTNYTTSSTSRVENTQSNRQFETVTAAATGTTQLQHMKDNLGNATTGYQIILSTNSASGNNTVTIDFAATDTIYDVMDRFAEYDINLSIDSNGRISAYSSTLSDFDISGTLGTFLMGSYEKVYGEGVVYNISTNLYQESVVNMSDETLLSDLNITNGNIVIYDNGTNYTIAIDNTKTVGEFRAQLADLGISSDVINGSLYLSGDGTVYATTPSENASNLVQIMGIGQANWNLGSISQESDSLSDTETVVGAATMDTKIGDLVDALGTSLGVTAGQIYVYQDGTRNVININTNDTLNDLANKLSQYGITMGISSDGKVYFDGNNNSYLTTDGLSSDVASNILTKFNVLNNWSTRYNSTSGTLASSEEDTEVVDGSTKIVDLQDSSGNSLGITEGTYYVYQNGVRNTESITSDTTVNDFIATLSTYGMTASFDESGALAVGANNETYLATSDTSGDDTNAIDVLFETWNFVNVYTSNGISVPEDVTVSISRTTKLEDINGATYQAGYITVVRDGVQTHIELAQSTTVGDLMDELALYGFESVINSNGQLILQNTGNSLLQAYSGSETASNALAILGIELDDWVSTSTYEGNALTLTSTSTAQVAATRDTLLSDLGVTTGEFDIWSNGVKYTAYISSDDTLGSLIDTIESFGLQTSYVNNPSGSVLTVIGSGDSYIAESSSVNNKSNVVSTLFANPIEQTNAYSAELETSALVTHTDAATEETLVSQFDEGVLVAAGELSVTVDGVTSLIHVQSDETIGSLLDKFRVLGLEATISDGHIMIQSGYKDMTINTDGTTSSAVTNLKLVYNDDLGGYVSSDAIVEQTVTTIEDRTISVSNYADFSTKMDLLNISNGSLTVYRDGEKATIQIDSSQTFGNLRSLIAARFSDVDLKFEDGYLTIYSTTAGVNVEVGATTDTSNFSAITGVASDGNGQSVSARELYCVNSNSLVTTHGLFRHGDVVAGTFTIGDAEFTITNTTRLSDIISQINATQSANATAYWDSIDGKMVIQSRSSGAALVNIEAGTSNFTDIMGLTTSEWADEDGDGNADIGMSDATVTKMNVNAQDVGDNARFSINGTYYTSSSNTIKSDVSRINGLTINLKGVSEGETTLKVERDKETIANAVSDVVDAYNELIENVDKVIAKGSPLDDQFTLKLIRNQIRSLMTNSIGGSGVFKNLDSIGISLDKATSGDISTNRIDVLTFDKDRFIDAYDADRDALKNLLVGTESNKGIFMQIESVLESAVGSTYGYFASADRSYSNQISRLDTKIKKENSAIERYRERLEAKFSSMDLLISQMQNQYSSFLGF